MLRSGLSALSDRVDSKFLAAYWLPAFVAVFGGFIILAVLVGQAQMDAWIGDLDSVEQGIGVAIVLLQITMLAFILRALTQPIAGFFAGSSMPQGMARWSIKGQGRARQAARKALGIARSADDATIVRPAAQQLDQYFPKDDADLQPTLLGNVLARAAEHPRIAYAMDGTLWWPRLAPLVPSYFQTMLGGVQAPLMALLNLSVIFSVLGLLGAAVLGLVGRQWPVAVAFLLGGAVLSRLCYHAAVSQAVEYGSMLRVAFDLYRYEILTQLDLQVPGDLAVERSLWQRLTLQLLDIPGAADSTAEGAAESPKTGDAAPGPA